MKILFVAILFAHIAFAQTNSEEDLGATPPEQIPYEADSDEDPIQKERQQEQAKIITQFTQTMGDFQAEEIFSFDMQPNQPQSIYLNTDSTVQSIRGIFHSEISDDEDDTSARVELTILNQYNVEIRRLNLRFGIFHIQNAADQIYEFRFSPQEAELNLYFAYELMKDEANIRSTGMNKTEIQVAADKFEKVNKYLSQQESELNRIMAIGQKHQRKTEEYLKHFAISIVCETLVIVGGSLMSLFILKKQIYAGYQSLV